MKTKKLIIVLLFVLLLGIGCNQNNNEGSKCKHEIESVAKQDATCTKEGNQEYYHCTKCNKYYTDKELTNEKTYEELVIQKTKHTESDWIIDNNASCTEKGLKHKECTVCKEKLQEESIDIIKHNYTEIIIAPTCDTQGYTLYTCSCGDEYKDNYVDAIGHNYSDWEILNEATEKETGLKMRKCLVCNKQETEIIPMVSHIHNYTESTIAPTCDTQGYTLHTCACGDNYKDNYLSAMGHTYNDEGKIILLENDKKAVTRYTCDKCSYFKDEVYSGYYLQSNGLFYFDYFGNRIDLNEIFVEVNGNTYYVINNIIVKNYYMIDGTIYNFGSDGIKQDTILTNKIITYGNDKYYVINNVIQKNTYEVYEQNIYYFDENGKAIKNTSYEGYTFGVSGYLLGNDILIKINNVLYYVVNNSASVHNHTIENSQYKAATCTENGNYEYYHCTECNRYYSDSNYMKEINADEIVIKAKHKVTKYERKENTCVDNGNIEYFHCTKCNKYYQDSSCTKQIEYEDTIIKASHNITKYEGKESTCTEQGYKAYEKCANCSYTTFESLPLKEHTLTDWIIDTEATCTQTGSKHKECSACMKIIETETIAALGHNYVSNVCTNCEKMKVEIKDGYIYFGEYPQTLKEKTVKITSTEPDADGYYLGSDGERYARVTAKPYKNTYYFNDKVTSIIDGVTYYFKVEPIKWKIEEEGSGPYKLISDLIIDCQMYYSSLDNRTIDGQTIYANNYKYSDIRSWLNNEFINKAFTEDLQEYINTIGVYNGASSMGASSDKFACENTYDKVYLPSYQEMVNVNYGYSKSVSDSDSARRKQVTDYAKAMGCYMNTGSTYYNNGYYWLRSPIIYKGTTYYNKDYSSCSYCAYSIDYYGDIANGVYSTSEGIFYFQNHEVNKEYRGVAPALTIQIY